MTAETTQPNAIPKRKTERRPTGDWERGRQAGFGPSRPPYVSSISPPRVLCFPSTHLTNPNSYRSHKLSPENPHPSGSCWMQAALNGVRDVPAVWVYCVLRRHRVREGESHESGGIESETAGSPCAALSFLRRVPLRVGVGNAMVPTPTWTGIRRRKPRAVHGDPSFRSLCLPCSWLSPSRTRCRRNTLGLSRREIQGFHHRYTRDHPHGLPMQFVIPLGIAMS